MKQSSVAALREAALRRVAWWSTSRRRRGARAALDRVTGLGELTAQPDREGAVALTAVLNSHVDAFVKAVATLDVVDLTIEEPDLEEAVLGFYGDTRRSDERASCPSSAAALLDGWRGLLGWTAGIARRPRPLPARLPVARRERPDSRR